MRDVVNRSQSDTESGICVRVRTTLGDLRTYQLLRKDLDWGSGPQEHTSLRLHNSSFFTAAQNIKTDDDDKPTQFPAAKLGEYRRGRHR